MDKLIRQRVSELLLKDRSLDYFYNDSQLEEENSRARHLAKVDLRLEEARVRAKIVDDAEKARMKVI